MIPSLPLLSCESSLSVKENSICIAKLFRSKKKKKKKPKLVSRWSSSNLGVSDSTKISNPPKLQLTFTTKNRQFLAFLYFCNCAWFQVFSFFETTHLFYVSFILSFHRKILKNAGFEYHKIFIRLKVKTVIDVAMILQCKYEFAFWVFPLSHFSHQMPSGSFSKFFSYFK